MSKQTIEKYQVFVYITAIVIGLLFGTSFSGLNLIFEKLLWPALGLLLYATFTQVSLSNLRNAFSDIRFLSIALTGNFIFIPLIVWGFLTLLPGNPAIQLGVALVLLVPCTDWFITFTKLGGGDTESAIAFSPLSLLFQIMLLPVYLFLFFGKEISVTLATNDMLMAFSGIIMMPFFLAFLTDKWAASAPKRRHIISGLNWLPVPLLAIVIFMISASQSQILLNATAMLWYPAICFIGFLLITPLLAKGLSRFVKLPVRQARVLAFSLGSRNSFVVLPIALALPDSFEITVFVIVLQSLIELFGMATYVWFIPKLLFRNR